MLIPGSTAALATKTLLSLPEYSNAQSIGVYLSMPHGEVVTKAIVHDALRQGKQIFVPYIYNNHIRHHPKSRFAMNMVSLHSKSDYEALECDAWGIPSVAEDSLAERSRILEDLENFPNVTSPGLANSSRMAQVSTSLDLIVMPGVAFDGGLGRLGHGKGFYDRFLKNYHDSKVCLLEQELKMPFLGACQDC